MELYQIILLLSITTTLLPISLSSTNDKYNNCSTKFNCGGISNIGYPFYDGSTRPDYCGYPGFQLDCSEDPPLITISKQPYHVKQIDVKGAYITVSRTDKWTDNCPDSLSNKTIDYSKFNYTSTDQNITFFYTCNFGSTQNIAAFVSNVPNTTTACTYNGSPSPILGYYLTQEMMDEYKEFNMFEICTSNIVFPALTSKLEAISTDPMALQSAFSAGFDLSLIIDPYNCSSCTNSGGVCGYNSGSDKFTCHCADADHDLTCRVKGKKKVVPIVIATAAGIMMLGLLVFFSKHILQKCKPITQDRSVEDCLKNYASLVPRRYTYANVKKMTNSFKVKLGEGGYGTVFKGSLHDGHAVAVKVWKQSKGDGKDFINEVMSISRTSHVNIVPLLGFCFEGHKRALIYEFMPNGSLEKFISGRDSNDNKQSLSASKLLEIVVGIARGLEYLHRGCNIRIVHFDIKPHNILLDEEFTPKISDFGLAKSFKEKESIISMSGARGTAGYIAPEVFLKSFGGVSYKSDVYSYGMMVLEMAGYTKRVDHNAENNSSEMYFPQWIYKQLEQETTIDHGGILNEEELERKMVLVGLWCIQTNPVNRPPMSRVVEMLEGKAALLEVPPIPSLASPPRQQQPTEDGSGSFYSSTT